MSDESNDAPAEELACRHCGATSEFWAWYPVDERQTIELETVGPDGFVTYDYTGISKTGDCGSDEAYLCGNCGQVEDTLEGLLGLPPGKKPVVPPLERTLDATRAAQILFGPAFYERRFNPATAQFASGADVCAWLAEAFGFSDDDYRELHRRTQAELAVV